ncbi:peptidylprolyl isomerase [Novosphingobium sp. ST904]|uniref:peptidylprolyl isomerase n=1 Tax=Novosphingobium sp. ST904 TaxID=1684385 RepID=UPI0006C8E3BB|nr:peptidylprolyl isomerase [Novosphingobium sp. ST904]KPH65794.1 peptidylprolyl isomerase [Novosphingobium sp. ST904]TCM29076.1 peptidylprolyl isomerase [Novosphingobium sp. ST904]
MHKFFSALAICTFLAAPLLADEGPSARTPNDVVAAAPAKDWVRIAPSNLLVMDLAPDGSRKGRRVLIQLMPAPFSQGWTGNIRKLVSARWYDGIAVVRVQDNYVVQWGDPEGENPEKAKPLPKGLTAVPEDEYVASIGKAGAGISSKDSYAASTMFVDGWPVGVGGGPGASGTAAWPLHCYGAVGVGRNNSPDTGTGAELYAVIGQAPRQLDRNIAVVGRVISGMENLSALPRGTGEIGFYKTAAERVAIRSVRMGSEVPGLPAYEYLSTDSHSFAAYLDKRANRKDDFYIQPAGGVDVCNVPVPIREVRP